MRTTGSMRLACSCTALAAGLACLGGCPGADFTSSRGILNPDTWSYKSKKDDPITLHVAGPVAIDVVSFNGSVKVTADDDHPGATVRVRRQATFGFGRNVDAGKSLEQIHYTAEVVPGDIGQVLQVRTWSSHPEPWFQRAHVQIDVPAVDGLTVRTSNGDVVATEIEGVVDIETSEGDVRVMTNRAMHRAVTIVNRQGDIDYRVRGESTGAFDCATVRGEVDHRVLFGRLIVERSGDDNLSATLNDGSNPIRLRTVDGDIRIAVVHNPTQIGQFIVDP